MPRAKRHLVNGGTYHIMMRGVNKQNIFNDDKDRQMFIRIMNYCKQKYNCEIYAYCLMHNHVHILFKDNSFIISDFMQYTASIYAEEFNKKYKRVGHLFQDRFKSIPVYNDNYLLRLIRYIHRNPEKAGICKTEDYKWSSYKEYVCKPKVIERDKILKKFDSQEKVAINKFKEFVYDASNDNLDRIYIADKLTDEDVILLIKDIVKLNELSAIKKYPMEKKIEIIEKISSIGTIKDVQIAKILGISKNFRSKMQNREKGV